MPDWKQEISERLSILNLGPESEAAIVDELSQHLGDLYEELMSSGMSAADARKEVLSQIDPLAAEFQKTHRPTSAPVETVEFLRGAPLTGLWKDFRYAARVLRKNPGFTTAVVVALALGIGANTAIFTVVNTLMLNPLAFRNSSELVAVETVEGLKSGSAPRVLPLSYPNLLDLQERQQVFSDVAAYSLAAPLTLVSGSRGERIFAEFVTPNFFETLGVRPVLGRFLGSADAGPDTDPVAVISYSAWQQRFGADPNIAGRVLKLNNNTVVTVVGVAPPGFKGVTVLFGPDLWISMAAARVVSPVLQKSLQDRGEPSVMVASRLKPGVSQSQAQANIDTLNAALLQQYPELSRNRALRLRPIVEAAQGDRRQSFLVGSVVLMIVVGLILLIACSNAASLFLARASGRRQEIAVRLALGAGRGRVIRQLLTESILLALLSGAAGLVVAYAGCQLLWSFRPPEVAQNIVDAKMDGTVLAYALAISLLTGVLFGLAPAIQATRADIVDAIKESARTAGRSRGRVHFRNLLLAGQVALSVVALIASGLFLRSIQRAYTIDPGFQTDHLAVFLINQGQAGYDRARAEEFYRAVRERVGSLPGVDSVSWSSTMPLWNRAARNVQLEGQEPQRAQDTPGVIAAVVDPNFFSTAGIRVMGGRVFSSADRASSEPVAIVNETMAKRSWPKQDAIGRRFRFTGDTVSKRIVGVVKTANYTGLGEDPQPAVYTPLDQDFSASMILWLRTRTAPSQVIAEVQRELRQIDPQLDVSDARTGSKIVDQALFFARIGVSLLGVFGLLALALVAVGLYGSVAYSVNQRQGEIGLRVALGASRPDVLRMVIGQGMKWVGIGLGVGVALALLLGQAMSTVLFGVSPADPVSFGGALAVLTMVALAACLIPARRAANLDPQVALRAH